MTWPAHRPINSIFNYSFLFLRGFCDILGSKKFNQVFERPEAGDDSMKKQFPFIVKRRRIVFFVGAILLPVAFGTVNYYIPHVAHTTIAPSQSPRFLVKQQPDAPLRLLFRKSNLSTAHTPEFEVIVGNDSVQPVCAYAIRYEILSGNSKIGGAELTNKMSTSSVLQSGQSESLYLGGDISYPDTFDNILISVDFVEFMDGTSWGPDISKSRERLLGLRAGARAATRYFSKVLKHNGPQAVMSAIKERDAELTPKSSHSPEWLDGFRGGMGAIRARLENAYTKNGFLEVESELLRPFDASEGRK